MPLTLETIAEVAEQEAELHRARPAMGYWPGRRFDLDGKAIHPLDNGQLQFHQSKHVIRTCAPGNGWGKSAVIAVEVDWWGKGDHPWPHELPVHRPRQMVWVAMKFQQWEMLKKVIHPWWPKSVVNSWHGTNHTYAWPDGSTLYIITSETSDDTIQGIEPDLVVGDEQIPRALAHEMLARRRADTTTRFVFNGTATQGLGWMYTELYLPWLKFHTDLGLTEQEAMRQQLHDYGAINPILAGTPGIWCWPKGGHNDNPRATAKTWAMLQASFQHFGEVEREVRLYGGYRDLNTSPVFNLAALERQRENLKVLGVEGWFVNAD